MGREHWVETTLNNVVLHKKGKKPKRLETSQFYNSLPYIDIEAFETGKIKQYADVESSNCCDENDVLVVWDGARFGLTGHNQNGSVGSTLACITPVIIETAYLLNFIQRHYQTIQSNPKGTGIPHVNPDIFWNLRIPLPPLNEQKRIVEKLDALLPKVKNAKVRLEKIPLILKKFRQSVLSAACSGRLTEDWREGKDLAEWEEKRLGELGEIKLGKMLDKAKNQGNPIKYLRNINVRWNAIEVHDIYEMNATESDLKKYSIKDGDLLICEGGEPGRCAIWNKGANQFIFQKAIHRVRLNAEAVAQWIYFCLKSDAGSGQLEKYFTGTTIKHFTLQSVKQYLIHLPSLEEQQEIVRRVEKLFTLADSLEAKYKKAIAQVEKIEQSLLAKAFRGELTTPDPNDEPASELLKRIHQEKSNLESAKKTRSKRSAPPLQH
jgi:type I restriction enzyme S subunit